MDCLFAVIQNHFINWKSYMEVLIFTKKELLEYLDKLKNDDKIAIEANGYYEPYFDTSLEVEKDSDKNYYILARSRSQP